MQAIGHLGRDAEVNIHGTNSVINFSIAHTEKYKDKNGTAMSKTIWISCAWWTDKTNIAQYLKKGTQVYVEGQPGVRMWRDNNSGENKCDMTCRVFSVQLLGAKKEEGQGGNQPAQQTQGNATPNTGYQPVQTNSEEGYDDLPF